jgi:periplasmic protein TonB
MESFPYVNGSHNPSSDTLHALPSTGLVSRLLCGCFGPRGRLSLYPEEDFSSENGPCSFELSDQDSSFFRTVVESHLDWELAPEDSAVQDLRSTSALPDWEVPGDSEPSGPPEYRPDRILEDGDFERALSERSSRKVFVTERLRSLAAGFVIHFVGCCLFLWVPTPSPAGLGGISDRPIVVRLPVTLEIETPDMLSLASVESPASTASSERRHPKPEQTKAKSRKESEETPAAELQQETTTAKPGSESRPTEATTTAEIALGREKMSPALALRDGPPNDSKSSWDSTASTPSLAAPERKGALKVGHESESYKDKILSAIHHAAYYPRAALGKMACGKALVSFTIRKDGSLAHVSIVHHAESGVLDEAALKIVQQASSHFPPIPDELLKDQVTYVVPIVFKKKS